MSCFSSGAQYDTIGQFNVDSKATINLFSYVTFQMGSVSPKLRRNRQQGQSFGRQGHYCNHIGGGVHVSVNTGYLCIDFRKFYRPEQETEMKPTRQGIALRIKQWRSLKQVIDSINDNFPALATAVPWYFSEDHAYQEDYKECYPYAWSSTWHCVLSTSS